MESQNQSNNPRDEDINIYYYWKIIVEFKKLIIEVCLIFLVSAALISFVMPEIFRGGGIVKITLPQQPLPITLKEIKELTGDINAKKSQIFTNDHELIDNVTMNEITGTNLIQITIDSKKPETIPQSFNDLVEYIKNIKEIKFLCEQQKKDLENRTKEISTVIEKNELILSNALKISKNVRNLVIAFNPMEISEKNYEMKIKKFRLGEEKNNFAVLRSVDDVNILKSPVKPKRRMIIAIAAVVGLFFGILIALLENIRRRWKVLNL